MELPRHPLIALDPVMARQFLKFTGIGVVSFLIDVVVFQATVSLGHVSPYVARVVSFFVATTAAWWLNRTFTFQDAGYVRADLQWARFVGANLVGGAINYAVFAVMISTLLLAKAHPVLALAAGSVSGVAFNFTAYRRYVFRPDVGL